MYLCANLTQHRAEIAWNVLSMSVAVLAIAWIVPSTGAAMPEWLQHIVGASGRQAALYRAMQLPGVQALYPRPPKVAQGELA